MVQQNISKRTVSRVLINLYSSNIFQIILSPERLYQCCQAVFSHCENEWAKTVTRTQPETWPGPVLSVSWKGSFMKTFFLDRQNFYEGFSILTVKR